MFFFYRRYWFTMTCRYIIVMKGDALSSIHGDSAHGLEARGEENVSTTGTAAFILFPT
jgi:hypothetical protein